MLYIVQANSHIIIIIAYRNCCAVLTHLDMSAHSESKPVGKSDRVLRSKDVKGDMLDVPASKLYGKSETKVKNGIRVQ